MAIHSKEISKLEQLLKNPDHFRDASGQFDLDRLSEVILRKYNVNSRALVTL